MLKYKGCPISRVLCEKWGGGEFGAMISRSYRHPNFFDDEREKINTSGPTIPTSRKKREKWGTLVTPW
jgi:hypothetical protein